jgi:hypothetical protein
MKELIEKIKEKINCYSTYDNQVQFGLTVENLEWILNELEKYNCENCKHDLTCCNDIAYIENNQKQLKVINYCSNFKLKE